MSKQDLFISNRRTEKWVLKNGGAAAYKRIPEA